MKCIYCGEELGDNSVFCSKCGKAVQIVPDYNMYDDDYLKQVLVEENLGSVTHNGSPKTGLQKPKDPQMSEEKQKEQKKKQLKILACVAGIICVLIFALLILGVAIRTNHANSFDYQVELAQKAYDKGDLEKAVEYYQNALVIDKNNVEVRLALAEIYVEQKEYDEALVLYQEVVKNDKKNRDAFGGLIAIYEKQENYDAIVSLAEVADESLKDLFGDYIVMTPSFSLEEGTFDTPQTLLLSADNGNHIFYTLDGSDPVSRGIAYSAPIELKENNRNYQIKAVCMNDKQIYSEVISKTYRIEIPAPDLPIVTPDGGDFGVETTVTITVPDGCTAYYTWDGSTPTAYSSHYSQPITIPEGNNILSVIIIDNSTGLSSDIYKGMFIYYPENYEDAAENEE